MQYKNSTLKFKIKVKKLNQKVKKYKLGGKYNGRKKGVLDGLFNFLNGAWIVNEGPTKARCYAYNE